MLVLLMLLLLFVCATLRYSSSTRNSRLGTGVVPKAVLKNAILTLHYLQLSYICQCRPRVVRIRVATSLAMYGTFLLAQSQFFYLTTPL